MWSRRLKGFAKKSPPRQVMRPNKAEIAVHGCLVHAWVKQLWPCVRLRLQPHHGVHLVFFPTITISVAIDVNITIVTVIITDTIAVVTLSIRAVFK